MSSTAGLQSKDLRNLFDIIDRLRSRGFNRYIDLPQIIVCGDQSAGKSSVLNAISGMSFPTKDKLCTRFATELVLRHDLVSDVRVSIIPWSQRPEEEREELSAWQPALTIDTLDFEKVVDEAKEVMGLTDTKAYSEDILRVELSGPSQPHLTLVDLPGLFKSSNSEQSLEQSVTVRSMIKRYMKQPRSIILAVVSARSEYVLQEVRELAKQADPQGLRTIGLITKPDTIDPVPESEDGWLKLIRNEDVPLRLGWHVIKNRDYKERDFTLEQRNESEKTFFSKGVWANLDRSQCGADALKERLSSELGDQILRQLPEMMKEVETGISGCKSRLTQLGSSRSTLEEQRRFLLTMSQEFTNLMTCAVNGHYNHIFFGASARRLYSNGPLEFEKRLRSVVQNKLFEFRDNMVANGEEEVIHDPDNSDDVNGYKSNCILRSEYIDGVKTRMVLSKGCELPGLFNPMIVGDLFQEQCRPWRGITEELAEEMRMAVYSTTKSIVDFTAANEVADEMLNVIDNGISQLKLDLDDKIKQLLEPHDVMHAITYNSALTDQVQTRQRDRRMRAVKKKVSDTFGAKHFNDAKSKISVNPAQLIELFSDEIEPDMQLYGSSLAADYMQAYYGVALKRYIDDVSTLAIEKCLISKLPSLFTPNMVFEMDQDQVEQLAAESKETADEREQIQEKLNVLEDGLRGFKRLHRRRHVVRPDDQAPVGEVEGRVSIPFERERRGSTPFEREIRVLTPFEREYEDEEEQETKSFDSIEALRTHYVKRMIQERLDS